MKTPKQIKEEVANEVELHTFNGLMFAYTDHEENVKELVAIVDKVATRYASQFQANTDLVTSEMCAMRERIAELEDALLSVVKDIDETNNPYLEITGETLAIIESLINKGK